MKRTFLYIDILGFEALVRANSAKVDQIFAIFDLLKVHKHATLQTIVFSDTILVFNKDESRPTDYFCTYLVEYTQALFYKLSLINVYFKAILTFGEFKYSQLSNIQAYYGIALIDAYSDEKDLEGFGLFVDKRIAKEVITFDKVDFTEKYEFVLLCQSLVNLYKETQGVLPINEISILSETDTFYRIDEDLRFLREIQFIKENCKSDKVKKKYHKVYDTYKANLPKFFEVFETEGFLPFSINLEYAGSINPFELLSEKELNANH